MGGNCSTNSASLAGTRASSTPRWAATAIPVPYPTVQDGPLSETAPLAADAIAGGQAVNYIQWLATASVGDIQQENYPGPLPSSLLYQLLRQSMLRCYVTLAGAGPGGQRHAGRVRAARDRAGEHQPVRGHRHALGHRRPPGRTGRARPGPSTCTTCSPPPGSPFDSLADLRASLDRLAVLPTAELDRLLTETLDAGSHRLDVWMTAVAFAVLSAQRATPRRSGPAGPAPRWRTAGWKTCGPPPGRPRSPEWTRRRWPGSTRAAASSGRTSSRRCWRPPADNGGFIHAPSMTQAAAGAVLRSGYMSHRGTPDEPVLAIDLSSDRTRLALWVLDGVRQGQPLGALTGYQFEQALHDAGLDAVRPAVPRQVPADRRRADPADGGRAGSAAVTGGRRRGAACCLAGRAPRTRGLLGPGAAASRAAAQRDPAVRARLYR